MQKMCPRQKKATSLNGSGCQKEGEKDALSGARSEDLENVYLQMGEAQGTDGLLRVCVRALTEEGKRGQVPQRVQN